LLEALPAQALGFVPLATGIELAWVSSAACGLDRSQLIAELAVLRRTKGLVGESAEVAWKVLRSLQSADADFADRPISGSAVRREAQRRRPRIAANPQAPA